MEQEDPKAKTPRNSFEERVRVRFMSFFLHKFMKERLQKTEEVEALFIYCVQSRVRIFFLRDSKNSGGFSLFIISAYVKVGSQG